MTTFVKGMQIEVFQRVLTVLLLLHIGFFYRYERDFKVSLSDSKQAYVVQAFNLVSRYLDVLL